MDLNGRCRVLRKMFLLTLICCTVTCYTWHILSDYPLIENAPLPEFSRTPEDQEGAYDVRIWLPRRIKSGPFSQEETLLTSSTDNNGTDEFYDPGDKRTTRSESLSLRNESSKHATLEFSNRIDNAEAADDKNVLQARDDHVFRKLSNGIDTGSLSDIVGKETEVSTQDSETEVSNVNHQVVESLNVSTGMLRLWGNGGAKKRLPQALIIGVKKCGTRALLEFLRLHPDIRATGPETHFFDRFYERGLEWYRQQMPQSLEYQITMEKTPSYFITREVPGRLHRMSPKVRLIVVVRDPVTRAISDYTQTASKTRQKSSFDRMTFRNSSTGLVDTSWSAIRIGVYSRFLEWWVKYFSLEQLHFVSGENLIRDPAGEMAMVQDFLGLKRIITDKHFYFNETKGFPCLKKSEGNGNPHCLGKTKGRAHPEISPSTITRLRDFYRPFNLKFYQMVGRDFGWQ